MWDNFKIAGQKTTYKVSEKYGTYITTGEKNRA
jgi:hypothetical protein